MTACHWDCSAQSSHKTQVHSPLPEIYAPKLIPSHILQVLTCSSIPSLFSSMDWATPIPTLSLYRSYLLNHPFMLFSSFFFFFLTHFWVVLLFLKAVSRKLVQDSSWDLTKLSWVEGWLYPFGYKPQLAFFTTVRGWWLTVSLKSTINSIPPLQSCCSASHLPFWVWVAHYSHLTQQLCASPSLNIFFIFPSDFSTWSRF